MLYERIVEECKEFDEKGRGSPCRSDMPTAPGQRVELHLRIKDDQRGKSRHHPLDRFASGGIILKEKALGSELRQARSRSRAVSGLPMSRMSPAVWAFRLRPRGTISRSPTARFSGGGFRHM